MRRRKLRWAVAGLAALLLVAGAFVFWPRALPPSRITRENFHRIRVGMSRAEVEAILGPPEDYANGDTEQDGAATVQDYSQVATAEAFLYRPPCSWQGDWRDDRIHIHVALDLEGKVFLAWCGPLQPVDHGSLGNLRWRAERQWRKWFPETPEARP
jgi:hypothetical protein